MVVGGRAAITGEAGEAVVQLVKGPFDVHVMPADRPWVSRIGVSGRRIVVYLNPGWWRPPDDTFGRSASVDPPEWGSPSMGHAFDRERSMVLSGWSMGSGGVDLGSAAMLWGMSPPLLPTVTHAKWAQHGLIEYRGPPGPAARAAWSMVLVPPGAAGKRAGKLRRGKVPSSGSLLQMLGQPAKMMAVVESAGKETSPGGRGDHRVGPRVSREQPQHDALSWRPAHLRYARRALRKTRVAVPAVPSGGPGRGVVRLIVPGRYLEPEGAVPTGIGTLFGAGPARAVVTSVVLPELERISRPFLLEAAVGRSQIGCSMPRLSGTFRLGRHGAARVPPRARGRTGPLPGAPRPPRLLARVLSVPRPPPSGGTWVALRRGRTTRWLVTFVGSTVARLPRSSKKVEDLLDGVDRWQSWRLHTTPGLARLHRSGRPVSSRLLRHLRGFSHGCGRLRQRSTGGPGKR